MNNNQTDESGDAIRWTVDKEWRAQAKENTEKTNIRLHQCMSIVAECIKHYLTRKSREKKKKELQSVSSLRARDFYYIGECLSVCLFKMIHFHAECVAGNLHLLCVPRSVSNTFSILIVVT